MSFSSRHALRLARILTAAVKTPGFNSAFRCLRTSADARSSGRNMPSASPRCDLTADRLDGFAFAAWAAFRLGYDQLLPQDRLYRAGHLVATCGFSLPVQFCISFMSLLSPLRPLACRFAFGWLCLCTTLSVARAQPVVSGLTAMQRAGSQLVDVTYNLASTGGATVEVTVRASKDGGTTFETVPPSALLAGGAFGTGQQAGTGKKITWDASKQGWETALHPTVQVEVTASFTTRFVPIPEGAFLMGGNAEVGYRWELPVHTVTVSAFYLQTKETSKAQWDRVRTWGLTHGYTDLYAGSGKAANHPVQRVSWYDVVKWCNAASEQAGLTPCYTVNGTVFRTGEDDPVLNLRANGYRLPTEAEWEKAARGGLGGMYYPWGNSITHGRANYKSVDMTGTLAAEIDVSPTRGYHPDYTTGAVPYTSPGGSFEANGFGLYDMAGNVYEWTGDWCGPTSSDYYSANPQIDPTGHADPYPGLVKRKYCRGGSWQQGYSACRSSYRYDASNVWQRTNQLGFRPASTSTSLAPTESHLSRSNIFALNLHSVDLEIQITALNWNTTKGGLDFEFTNTGGPLGVASTAELFWGDGTLIGDILASPSPQALFIHPIPAGFTGKSARIHIGGALLKNAPAATTHLLLVLDRGDLLREENRTNNVAALADARFAVNPGVSGNISSLTDGVIKDALRYAGEAEATIVSLTRTNADQARVMFEVLGQPLSPKIIDKLKAKKLDPTPLAYSYDLYGSYGDQVLAVYETSKAAGKSDTDIKADMTAKIDAIKRSHPSAFGHTADPTVLQVVDIGAASITNRRLFNKAISPATDARIIRYFSPFTNPVDKAFHLEVPQAASPGANRLAAASARLPMTHDGSADAAAPLLRTSADLTFPPASAPKAAPAKMAGETTAAGADPSPRDAQIALVFEEGSALASGSVSTSHRVFTFSATAGNRLTAGLAVTGVLPGAAYTDDDSVIWLFDPEGRLVADNDDTDPFASEFNSLLDDHILTRNGTYHLVVTTFGNAPTFDHTGVVNGWEDDGGSAIDFELSVRLSSRASQLITLHNPGEKTVGDAPFAITVASSSGLVPVLRILSGPATLEGTMVTLTGAGTVILYASEEGDDSYEAAAPVVQIFEVYPPKTNQRITFGQPGPRIYGGEPFTPTATASSGLAVRFEIVSSTPAGIASLDADGRLLSILGAGKATLRATQPGDAAYQPAAPVTRTLLIGKRPLLVSGVPVSRLVGTANPPLALSYTGFAPGDDFTDLAVATLPKPITRATKPSPAGRYPVTFTGGLDKNYTFSAGPVENLTVVGFGGTYEALLVDDTYNPVGKLTLTLPANALTYTGSLKIATEEKLVAVSSNTPKTTTTTAFTGPATGAIATATWTRPGGTAAALPALRLQLTVSADGTFAGTLDRDGLPFATLRDGSRVSVFPKGQTAPGAGANTLALHPAYNLFADGPLPGGSGHATASIALATGVLTVKGSVADGMPLTATLKPTQTGYHLWANPYGTRALSFLAGRLALQPHPDQTRFPGRSHIPSDAGLLVWEKAPLPDSTLPAKRDRSYRAGFGPLGVPVSLDPWLPPSAKASPSIPAGTLAQRLGLASSPTAPGTFSLSHDAEDLDFGAREAALPFAANLAPSGALTVPGASATSWTIKLTPATGAFSGSFVLSDQVAPPPAKPTLRTVHFSGTLRQTPDDDPVIATGFFLLPSLDKTSEHPSGEIRFSAPTTP